MFFSELKVSKFLNVEWHFRGKNKPKILKVLKRLKKANGLQPRPETICTYK
jgi:hypothetical protein